MSETRKYYEAYDDRYRQVHEQNLRWFMASPSPIVGEVIDRYGISKQCKLLEIGCGEGRDARHLLNQGYDLLATDISAEAVAYCCRENPRFASSFRVFDCVKDRLEEKFDFIFAVAVVHMLVLDEDRDRFYQCIREHLKENAIALVCTMGDGKFERKSDISTAFELQERTHEESGQNIFVAGTSYRAVSFETFCAELKKNELIIVEQGIILVEPDYHQMMYAVVKRG